ncbi:unnamed protein product [Effrenium voratum]|nr:unnamed protein product [Effrenium voratum]
MVDNTFAIRDGELYYSCAICSSVMLIFDSTPHRCTYRKLKNNKVNGAKKSNAVQAERQAFLKDCARQNGWRHFRVVLKDADARSRSSGGPVVIRVSSRTECHSYFTFENVEFRIDGEVPWHSGWVAPQDTARVLAQQNEAFFAAKLKEERDAHVQERAQLAKEKAAASQAREATEQLAMQKAEHEVRMAMQLHQILLEKRKLKRKAATLAEVCSSLAQRQAAHARDREQLSAQLKEAEQDKAAQCLICQSRKATRALPQCGHIPFCEPCFEEAQRLGQHDRCPLCRSTAAFSFKVRT